MHPWVLIDLLIDWLTCGTWNPNDSSYKLAGVGFSACTVFGSSSVVAPSMYNSLSLIHAQTL